MSAGALQWLCLDKGAVRLLIPVAFRLLGLTSQGGERVDEPQG